MSKEVAREYVARFDQGDTDGLRELFHEDAQVNLGDGWRDVEEMFDVWQAAIDGLGVDLEIESIVAQDDVVAVLYTERGWSRAPYLGRAANGRAYELSAVDWFVIREGRIARLWSIRDTASQAEQLGWPIGAARRASEAHVA